MLVSVAARKPSRVRLPRAAQKGQSRSSFCLPLSVMTLSDTTTCTTLSSSTSSSRTRSKDRRSRGKRSAPLHEPVVGAAAAGHRKRTCGSLLKKPR